jgi:hypothetical protein
MRLAAAVLVCAGRCRCRRWSAGGAGANRKERIPGLSTNMWPPVCCILHAHVFTPPNRYHRYCIKEAPDRFVLTTHSPGEAQEVQETPHAAFRQDLKR